MLLLGCAGTKLPASVNQGLDRAFPEPPHEIRGLTRADQAWINETIEAGSTCCSWQVKPRPPGLDNPTPLPKPAPKAKPRLRDRLKLWPTS